MLLKSAAYFCDRDQVLVVDLLLLRHCLWTQESNREPTAALVRSCISQFGQPDRIELDKWEANHSDLESQINEVFFYTEDVLATEKVGDKDCVPFTVKLKRNQYGEEIQRKYYGPTSNRTARSQFHPLKEDGSQEEILKCAFSDNVLIIKIDSDVQSYGISSGYRSNNFVDLGKIKLALQFKKGSTRDVPSRVRQTFVNAANNSKNEIGRLVGSAEGYRERQIAQNDTPFVPAQERLIALTAIRNHVEELKNHQLNAEHLCDKVANHVNAK